jgi:hypothetical protein
MFAEWSKGLKLFGMAEDDRDESAGYFRNAYSEVSY